jgi:hypothetical protein
MAQAAVVPAVHQGSPLKGPLEQALPRLRVHASLERAPPRSRVHVSLERDPPRSRVHSPLEQAPPRSRPFRTHTPVPARGYGHLMLWQRRGGTIMRLGLTPRSCCTNSLGGTHLRHCGGLCDMVGVSPVTPRRLLPYD